ncbi:MAG: UbiA family prenyltransferase, partial [Parasphingopyxis sp.]|uniref:UbiA family prenyltransferase n=1 Tax=Parasphingopyxis sp. TaxID=1920299 RepID=UPI003FA19246
MPILLFTLIFLWTPPHFWALSLFVNADYARAGVPMMTVVAGTRSTRRQMLAYTIPMAAVAIAPWPLGLAGAIYGVTATALSLVFLALAIAVVRNPSEKAAHMVPEKRLFLFSILYLFALFGALVVDAWAPTILATGAGA